MNIDRIAWIAATREKLDSRCRIEVESGSTFDPATGEETATPTVVADDTACLVRPMSMRETTRQFGDRPVAMSGYTVKVDAAVVAPVEALVTVLSSRDPAAVGMRLRVRDAPADDWLVHRILVCEKASA